MVEVFGGWGVKNPAPRSPGVSALSAALRSPFAPSAVRTCARFKTKYNPHNHCALQKTPPCLPSLFSLCQRRSSDGLFLSLCLSLRNSIKISMPQHGQHHQKPEKSGERRGHRHSLASSPPLSAVLSASSVVAVAAHSSPSSHRSVFGPSTDPLRSCTLSQVFTQCTPRGWIQ